MLIPNMSEEISLFAESLKTLLLRTEVFAGKPLRWLIVANPTAGGFTMRRRWKVHKKALSKATEQASKLPLRKPSAEPAKVVSTENPYADAGLVLTTAAGHAKEIVAAFLEEAKENLEFFYLLIVAGGDGTSLEALSTLYYAPEELRQRMAILRLPLGTGNDGADRRDLGEALLFLSEKTRIAYKPALQLFTAKNQDKPYLAFNILSIGLDAFVTDTTNKIKCRFPGDSYTLVVDLASVFYDILYPPACMEVKLRYKGQEEVVREKFLLLAMGVSGHRTYGSNKKILPDERNVCGIRQMNLFKKLIFKGAVMDGEHTKLKDAFFFHAEEIEIQYSRKILAQTDGDGILLGPEDFPIRFVLSEDRIPVLLRAHSSIG